jgi:carboxylesterase type B
MQQAVMCRQTISGAPHGADLPYLFETDLPIIPFPPLDDDSMEISKKMLKMWINFAKTG